MLTIVTALPWEAERFTRRLRGHRRNEAGEGWAVWGDRGRVSVRVVVSGPGMERATDAATAVRDLDPSTTGILAVGVAAGIAEELKPGALVLAQRTLHRRIDDGRARGAITTDPKLRECCAAALERSGLRWSRGDVVTVDRAVAAPAQKRRLGTEAGAVVALMEGLRLGAGGTGMGATVRVGAGSARPGRHVGAGSGAGLGLAGGARG